jgi:hypothetical protein
MIQVQFPEANFKIKEEGEKALIFCAIRKVWLVLTEEEWVRQRFVQFLVEVMQYPLSFIALEKELMLNGLKKRFDVLVFSKDHQPLMLVECKAPEVPLNDEVLEQALRYHISIPVRFIVLTNGKSTFAWEKTEGTLRLLSSLPIWTSLAVD